MLNTKAQEKTSVWESIRSNEFLYTLWGVFLLFLTSQISIPLEPVPITLQTFGVMLIGLTFAPKTALKSIASYLALGALGAPMFANFKGGYPIFMGPTGGYLLGFLAAIFAMVSLRKVMKQDNFWSNAFICAIGTAVIFICGLAWLSQFLGINKAIEVGFVPFIVPGIVKILLLITAVKYVKTGYFFK